MTKFKRLVECDDVVYRQAGYTLDHSTGYLQALYVPIAKLREGCDDAE